MYSIRDHVGALVENYSRNEEEGSTEAIYRRAVEETANGLFDRLQTQESENARLRRKDEAAFASRNYKRWREAFDRLTVFRHYCIEAGQDFQEEYLRHEGLDSDHLVGVLMRLHARGCRIMGEITTLLANGYADGAMSRWRTLHEIAIASILIQKGGKEVAEDYICYGILQAVNGMHTYQSTASAMGREPYTREELEEANVLRDKILQVGGGNFRSKRGWARTHFGSSKIENLQRIAGLERWLADYALASQDVHAEYRDMRALYVMSEANKDQLLCGSSDAGMAEPAHSAAITLARISEAFLTAYVNDEDSPIDYTVSAVWIRLIKRACEAVGDSFEKLHRQTSS